MASTASRLSGDRGVSPFYYLKITGIPYYFFATVDPTSSAHGAAAWTLPAGFSSKRAMDVPHAKLTQSIDLIGGIATPQRLKVEMVDFQASDASGQYNFFSRLFATGRSLSSSAVKKSFLSADLAASGAATFKSVGPDTFAASGDVYLGNETIGYSAVSRAADADGNMVNTFTISARNKYPCASTFPPNPYYRVRRDSAGKALGIGDVPVTSDLVTIVGRSCALYLGHVTQSSLPCTEAEAQLLFVGRVTAFDFVGGRYSIEADSIVADLANDATRVAPGLPIVEVKDQIVLTDPEWRTMSLGVYGSDSVGGVASREGMKEVTVTSGVYKLIGHLVEEVNRKIDASSLTKHGVRCELKTIGKEQRVTFSCVRPKDAAKNFTFTISGDKARAAGDVFVHGRSLLSALGWPPDANQTYTADDANTYELAGSYDKRAYIVAPRPPPSVFIPYDPVSTGQLFTVNGDDQPGSRFFTDQLDGSTQAWVRFGGQQVVQLVTADAANSQLRTSGPLESTVYGPGGIDSDAFIPTMVGYYYVPIGQTGTVEQVIVTPSIAAVPAPNGLIIAGSFMASSWGAGALHDLNFWPEGVGLGYQAIMDEPSFRVSTGYKFRRFVIVDRNTTLRELLEPVLKEHGLWLVWDPSVGKLTVRQQKLPSAATADSLSMDETNRSDDKEMTTAVWDRSFVRSGWEIHWGWQARGREVHRGADVLHRRLRHGVLRDREQGRGDRRQDAPAGERLRQPVRRPDRADQPLGLHPPPVAPHLAAAQQDLVAQSAGQHPQAGRQDHPEPVHRRDGHRLGR